MKRPADDERPPGSATPPRSRVPASHRDRSVLLTRLILPCRQRKASSFAFTTPRRVRGASSPPR